MVSGIDFMCVYLCVVCFAACFNCTTMASMNPFSFLVRAAYSCKRDEQLHQIFRRWCFNRMYLLPFTFDVIQYNLHVDGLLAQVVDDVYTNIAVNARNIENKNWRTKQKSA